MEVSGAVVAEFSHDLSGAELSGAGEAHEDAAVLAGGGLMADTGGELGDARDEGRQHGDEGSDHLAPGLGLGGTGEALGRGAQAGEQLLGAAPAAVAVLDEEAREALDAQPGGAVGGRGGA